MRATIQNLLRRSASSLVAGAEIVATRRPGSGLSIEWSPVWTKQHDEALNGLRFLDDGSRYLHRLLGQRTSARKVHGIVQTGGAPVAVLSLRRRPGFWEPASAQCLPGTPIACDQNELGRVLNGLGRVVGVGSFYDDPADLRPQSMYSYERFGARLDDEYESYWQSQGRIRYRTARERTADFDVRVDHPGDLEWTIKRWASYWANDEQGQVASAADRLTLWGHLLGDAIHTVMVTKNGMPVAGCVHYCVGSVAKFECTGRDPGFDKQRVGIRVFDASFAWAKSAGYKIYDMGGGPEYKRWWAPPYATSYGAEFVPPLVHRARCAADGTRSLVQRLTGNPNDRHGDK